MIVEKYLLNIITTLKKYNSWKKSNLSFFYGKTQHLTLTRIICVLYNQSV